MKPKTQIISFRADFSLCARVDKEREQLDLSRGQFVHELTISHFHEREGAADVPAQLTDLRVAIEEMAQLLTPIASNDKRSLYILLTTIGKLDPEKAKEIVKSQLRS